MALSTFWNLCETCFLWYNVWKCPSPISVALNLFLCRSGKCFGRRHCGFASGLLSALSLGTQGSHFSFRPLISLILSFSFPPSLCLPHYPATFSLNKFRNAGAYFLNLERAGVPVEERHDWQGSVLEWLRGSLFASESRFCLPRFGLQYRAGKPKHKNNTGVNISFAHIAFLSLSHLSLSLSLPSFALPTCSVFVSSSVSSSFSVCVSLWSGVRFLVAESILRCRS